MHAVVELSWEVRVQTTEPYGYIMHNEVGTCEEILPISLPFCPKQRIT